MEIVRIFEASLRHYDSDTFSQKNNLLDVVCIVGMYYMHVEQWSTRQLAFPEVDVSGCGGTGT
jgi:hypothetical protein